MLTPHIAAGTLTVQRRAGDYANIVAMLGRQAVKISVGVRMTSLFIHNGLILPCDSDTRTAIPRGYVFVQDDRIAAVGADDTPRPFSGGGNHD